MTDAEDQWTRRLGRAVEAVRLWESTVGEPPEVQAGSEMALDDAEYREQPLSQVAWWSLVCAIDHLGMSADLLTAEGGMTLRPQAFDTVGRSALLAGAQALWILEPRHRPTRVERALMVVADERKHHLAFLRELVQDKRLARDVGDAPVEEAREEIARLTESQRAVRRELRARNVKAEFEATDVIREVGRHLPADDLWVRRALTTQWRIGSAAAHGRMWPIHLRPNERVKQPDGSTIARITGSVEQVGVTFGAATLVVSHALDRFHELRVNQLG